MRAQPSDELPPRAILELRYKPGCNRNLMGIVCEPANRLACPQSLFLRWTNRDGAPTL